MKRPSHDLVLVLYSCTARRIHFSHALGQTASRPPKQLNLSLQCISRMSIHACCIYPYPGGLAWFEFDELCGQAVGSPDFVALASAFHTVFLVDVPQLSGARRDRVRRFITLIDELYNRGARLYMSTAVPFDELFADLAESSAEQRQIDLMALAEGMQFEGEALEEAVGRRPLAALEAAPLAIGDSNRDISGGADAAVLSSEGRGGGAGLQSTLYTGAAANLSWL